MRKTIIRFPFQIDEDSIVSGDQEGVIAVVRALGLHSRYELQEESLYHSGRFRKNYVVRQPVEVLADVVSFLDRFSLDQVACSCLKLRTAVASLGPQNLRNLSSVRVEVTDPDCDKWVRDIPVRL